MSQKQSRQISLQELQNMCALTPQNVTIAKKSASNRASKEFNLNTDAEIKKFISDGLENPVICKSSESDQNPGTTITAYKFNSGRKNGYLAFHESLDGKNGIHIKSFHEDDTNPSLGTLGDLFKEITLGEKK